MNRWRESTAKALLIAASLLFAFPARGQGFDHGTLFALDWELAQPLYDLRNFVDTSPYGAAIEARFALGRHFSTGLELNWNSFTDGPNHGIDAFAAGWTGHWYLSRSSVQPYLGVGVGPMYRRMDPSDDFFGLSVDPQLGCLFTLDKGVALNVAVRYEFTTTWAYSVYHSQWLGFRVGIAAY